MATCDTCGAENRDSARFCDACGAAMVAPSLHPDPGDSPLPPIPSSARKAKKLNERFVLMGILTGRTRAEIEGVVGPPTSISSMADGILLQWMETRVGFLSASSYHIALTFDVDGICTGVTHEFGV